MCFLPQLEARPRLLLPARAILLMFLATNVSRAAPVELPGQWITLPANANAPLFADIDGDGRSDLLVMDPVEKRLLNYHQRPNGFTNSPDQSIPLPPKTAWVAPCDVDAHPGLELQTPANDAVRKILEDMQKSAIPPGTDRVDVNGDGREDLLLWQVSGKLDFKTDLYLFLRGADQQLPERPTQVLHCRGFPIPLGSTEEWSAVKDLNGDGRPDLLARLSAAQWSIFLSTADGHWFAPQPAMTFAAPTHGHLEITDLNGDGLADIISHEPEGPRLSILLSPPRQARSRKP